VLLLMLGALRLLLWLPVLLLLLLGALRLLLWLPVLLLLLLGALRLLLWLPVLLLLLLLSALRLLLWLPVLLLFLVLLLRLCWPRLLPVLVLLGVRNGGGSEKQKQDCRARQFDRRNVFHVGNLAPRSRSISLAVWFLNLAIEAADEEGGRI
jgi:hypothetical protein